MFSGLVTAISSVLEVREEDSLLKLVLKRPDDFKELQTGESIAVDGVCLTLKSFDEQSMSFDLGPETLKITGWTMENIKNKTFNLERSLCLQSAVGGQILTGHVDGLAQVIEARKQGESCLLTIQAPKKFKAFIWDKGYLALNGVSLTVNKTEKTKVELCLIPETLKRTNLSLIKEGDRLNFEVDYMSRPAVNAFQSLYKKIRWLFFVFACLFVFLFFFIQISFYMGVWG
ncbi:MAG: riboflavin synthase [Oligoflexia bacterium]|nr:riboflavin synthase [Oligoflexia bacterium]